MKVGEIMEPAASFDGEEVFSKLVGGMPKLREIMVTESRKPGEKNKTFLGMVTRHTLMRAISYPPTTKLKHILFKPQVLSKNDKVEEAITALLNAGVGALPVVENGKLIGIVSIDTVIKQLDAGTATVKDIMSSGPPVTVTEKTPLSTASAIMKNHGINRLLVVDGRGELVGIITASDILKKVIVPKRRERSGERSQIKQPFLSNPISSFMTRKIVVCSPDEAVESAMDKMLKHNLRNLVVVSGGKPVGLIGKKHVLKLMDKFSGRVLPVSISGLGNLESFETVPVREIIYGYVQKIGKVASGMESFSVAVKRISTNKYEANIRVGKKGGSMVTQAVAFDVVSAISQALRTMDRKVRHG